jgi:hypothetical protein
LVITSRHDGNGSGVNYVVGKVQINYLENYPLKDHSSA